LNTVFHKQFDCVASTGNSLPYVRNDEVMDVISQMDALVRPGGYLYLDLRNWDLIQKTRQRFYLYNPVFDNDIRINLTQAWDYYEDGTMDFNLLFYLRKGEQNPPERDFYRALLSNFPGNDDQQTKATGLSGHFRIQNARSCRYL